MCITSLYSHAEDKDFNNDSLLNINDALTVLNILVNTHLTESELNKEENINDVIGIDDAIQILQSIARLDIKNNFESILGLVLTPNNIPVQNAMLEDVAITDAQGVALGGLPNKNWIKVQASGFAPNYTKALGKLESQYIFETVLTPVAASTMYRPGEFSLLQVNKPDLFLQVDLEPQDFDQDVDVSLTPLNPLHIQSVSAPVSNSDKQVSFVFSLEAVDRNGKVLQPIKPVTLTYNDAGKVGEEPQFAIFNPEIGKWEVKQDACSRTDVNNISCEIPHFSLMGFLGDFFEWPSADGYEGAQAELEKAASDWAEDGGGVPSEEINNALDKLANEASNYADNNLSEVAKQRLLSVAARACFFGNDAVRDTMWAKAQELTLEITEPLLNGDCKIYRELLRAMAQCQLLGLYERSRQFEVKIKELKSVCNVWQGVVNVKYLMENPYTYTGETFKLYSGQLDWTEKHQVDISINPKDLKVNGDNLVKISFPKVTYRTEVEHDPCGENYSERSNWGEGDKLYFTFTGSFQKVDDRPRFVLDPLKKESGKVALWQTQYVQSIFEDEGACIDYSIGPLDSSTSPDFKTLLGEAFSGTPPLSIQEMLNQGNYQTLGRMEIIEGSKLVEIDNPAVGAYPFRNALISWTFVHELLSNIGN